MRYNNTMFPNDRTNAIVQRARALIGRNQAENEGTGRMMRNYWRIRNARDRMLRGAQGNANG